MTIIQPSSIPVSVNYTGRDFYTLRDQLAARIQDRIPNWTGNDPADFGVALVEAFAYMGDVISYYIDRNANENSIFTATQRRNLLNIAQTYGFIPSGYRQAYLDITFTNTSNNDVTMPAGTVVSGQVITADTSQYVYFTTTSEALVGANSSYTINATEGRTIDRVNSEANSTYGEQIGTSTGQPNQVWALSTNPVVDGSIQVYVLDGDVYSKWNAVQHLSDYGPQDLVYTTTFDDLNNVYINFGDGVLGAIPTPDAAINAMYVVGGGTFGNINANLIDTISYVPGLSESQTTALQSIITPSNQNVAVGGADPDSNDQIRQSAAASLRAGNRAVTLKDFADLAVTVSGIGKANAVASDWHSVTLYIAPARNAGDTDIQPGYDDANNLTTEYTNISSAVSTFLTDKVLIGTSVTVQPPTYVDVVITMQYVKLAQYTTAEVETNLKSKLLTVFGYTGMNFQDTIYPQDIEYVLNQTVGVKVVKLTALYEFGGSGLNTLTGAANEIFRFQEANINLGAL